MRSTTKVFNRLALSTIILASIGANAELKSFVPSGGSCMSQSSWTQKALEQTDVIATTLAAMQKDPDCKAVVDAIGGGKLIPRPGDIAGAEEAYRAETVMQELASLRDVLMQNKNTSVALQLNPVIAEATVEAMDAIAQDNASSARDADIKNLKARVKNTTAMGVQILTNLFQVLPQQKECMDKRPDLSAALVMGGIKVASAFALGDMGMSVQMAEMTANFLTYLQDSKFSKVQKSLNQQKLWSELSCLTETAQASYCSVQDGFGLLKIQRDFLNRNYTNTPIEGFYLMSREVPAVSDWIEKIRNSIDQNRSKGENSGDVITGTDDVNLSDEAVAGTTESVRASLNNVRSYMVRLYQRIQSRGDSQPILLSLLDSVGRIDRVLAKFRDLDNEASRSGVFFKKGSFILDTDGYSDEVRAEHAAKFSSLIATAYKEFNVKTQDSSFFAGRIATYVRHEYDVRLKNEDFSKYTNQLLASARGTVTDKLKEYQQFNIAEAEADLSQASNVHMANLDSLEKFASAHLEDYLVNLNKRAGHSFACSTRHTGFWQLPPFLTGDCTFFAAKQDLNNEAENIRAKVCIQTLGFKDYQRFIGLCRGAVLKSSQVVDGRSLKGLRLEYKYNDLVRQRVKGENLGTKFLGLASANRYSQVCLLRDYFRNNFVHWLTMRQQQK